MSYIVILCVFRESEWEKEGGERWGEKRCVNLGDNNYRGLTVRDVVLFSGILISSV